MTQININNAISFSKQFAEKWLSEYMLRDNQDKAKEIANALSDNRRWLSHGKRIGIKEAQELGLNVELIKRDTKLWKYLWEYFGRAQIMMNSTATIKLYECSTMGINFSVRAERVERLPPSQGS